MYMYLCINIDKHFTGSTDDTGDYVYQNYSYSFKDPSDTYELLIRPIDDNIVEPDKSYTLVISFMSYPFDVELVNNTATVTIYNDDGKQLCMYCM